MADEVIEAVDLEMAGEILAARGLSIVSVVGTATKDPRQLTPHQQQPTRSSPQQVVVESRSVFGPVVLALLFVFFGIPFIIFVAIPVSIMLLAWIASFFTMIALASIVLAASL